MIEQGFTIGDNDWTFEVYYDVKHRNLYDIRRVLMRSGCTREDTEKACDALSAYDSGYTFTNFKRHLTIMVMSRTTSAEQMYDSISHERRHATDHIGEYYNLRPNGETIAYLQGEIARKMFPAAALTICRDYGTRKTNNKG